MLKKLNNGDKIPISTYFYFVGYLSNKRFIPAKPSTNLKKLTHMKLNKYYLSILVAFAVNQSAKAQTVVINTIAGIHTSGYRGDDGPASACEMSNPNEAHFDAAGNIYIADYGNNVIRKISTSGIITTVAGSVTPGYTGDGGPATAATLAGPVDVAVDAMGNLFIADNTNNCIRKVNTAGIISTYAGTSVAGYSGDGGNADTAEFYSPSAIAIDASGNLFISDAGNNCIRKINPAGIISTVAGDTASGYSGDGGPATAAALYSPEDIAVDNTGNLFIADIGNNVIRKVNTAGIISTYAGTGGLGYTGDNGPATAAQMQYPYAVATDTAGNLYITDNANFVIRKVNTAGIITSIAGNGSPGYSGDGGLATAATFNNPGGVDVNRQGDVIVSDFGNNVIRKIFKLNNTGVEPVAANDGLTVNISPNPVVDLVSVDIENCTAGKLTLQIRDITGKIVLEQTQTTTNSAHFQANLQYLSSGVYLMQLIGNAQPYFSRIVKE